MVYMSFPNSLTDEEKNLQKKYAELRRKKKILASIRAQKKPETKEPNKEALKRANEDAADNTEQAKKLLKSGIIKVAIEKKDNQTFKRSKRQKDTEKSAVGFQPFSPNHSSETDEDQKPEQSKPKMKNLYESFVSPREKGPRPDRHERHGPREIIEPPKKGNTVHVFGHGITEEIVRKAFSNYGRIININMERDKNCGFVTFEKMESADKAITELNSAMVSEVKLRVSMARRQPNFEPVQDQSKMSWSTIAASSSQKGGHQDKRSLVVHDADDIF